MAPLRRWTSGAVLVVACAIAMAAGPALHAPWEATGTVGRIYDGDTFDLRTPDRGVVRIRFSGMDAPERGQPYSRKATDHLGDLLRAGIVTVRCYKDDGNQREVCDVAVDGLDVGLQMIAAGWAWHFKRFEHEQSPDVRAAYAQAQAQAQAQRVGLWAYSTPPMPPWECRQRKRQGQACQ